MKILYIKFRVNRKGREILFYPKVKAGIALQSGGGAWITLMVPSDEDPTPRWEAAGYGEVTLREEMPQGLQFLDALREVIPLAWRANPHGEVEIAVRKKDVGALIGPNGKMVRAIEQHVGRKVRVLQAVYVTWYEPAAFAVNTERGTGNFSGCWVAPWEPLHPPVHPAKTALCAKCLRPVHPGMRKDWVGTRVVWLHEDGLPCKAKDYVVPAFCGLNGKLSAEEVLRIPEEIFRELARDELCRAALKNYAAVNKAVAERLAAYA